MRRNQKGQAMVETAFILAIFLFTLIAIIDFGQFLFFQQSITERIRLAARYGALNWDKGCDSTCVKNFAVYGQSSNQNGGSFINNLTTSNISVTMPDTTMDARVVVSVVNYQIRVFTPFFGVNSITSRPIVASSPIESPN